MRLKIIKAGLHDTVQDAGRYGYQHLGINPGGAMDRFSAALTNALLGKELQAPVIELHFPAARILFEDACVVCISGADFTPTINGLVLPLHQPVFINAGAVMSFEKPKQGARCYLSFLNEWTLPKWLGSYSTNSKAAAGGYKGRKLQRGDELLFEPLFLPPITNGAFTPLPWRYNATEDTSGEVEFIVGNEWNWLDTESQTAFLNNQFFIQPDSDRMGYRLRGEVLKQIRNDSLVSSAVSAGTIQLFPNGQLIVLMADHQTTGGYPRIGHVISAHLSRLAQRKPGDEVSFVMTTLNEAEEKAATAKAFLSHLQNTCNLKVQNWLNAH